MSYVRPETDEQPITQYDLRQFILPKDTTGQTGGDFVIQPYYPEPHPVISPISDTTSKPTQDYRNGYLDLTNDIAESVPVQPVTEQQVKSYDNTFYSKSIDKTVAILNQPAKQAPATDVPVGPPALQADGFTPYIPPTTGPTNNGDLTKIAEVYGALFPGGGSSAVPAPTEQGPVLLYPVTYQKAAEPAKKQTSPLIFLILAAVLLGGWFLYKRFAKKE